MLTPVITGDIVRRHIFMSNEIQKLVEIPMPTEMARKRIAGLRAELEAFVRGDQIAICLHPYKAGKANMGRLDRPADEVWDFRSVKKPGLRIFGRFSERDVFVALTCWPRSIEVEWLDRPPLRENESQQFNDAINGCKAEWQSLLHPYEPLSGGHVSDYISDKYISIGD